MNNLCGIDEAGRGCCAGDLVVAGVIFNTGTSIEGLMDSKKLSQKRREQLFEKIINSTQNHIVVISPLEIDTLGLSKCMSQALLEIQKELQTQVYLFDGNTSFGVSNLQTLVKADTKIAQVSAASILAKVTHDRNIIQAGQYFKEYGFERHKGYATAHHIEMIRQHGYTPLHRKSFLIKALQKTLF